MFWKAVGQPNEAKREKKALSIIPADTGITGKAGIRKAPNCCGARRSTLSRTTTVRCFCCDCSTLTKQLAVRVLPRESVAVTVAPFVPDEEKLRVTDWLLPLTAPTQLKCIGDFPPLVLAEKVALLPVKTERGLAWHESENVPGEGVTLETCRVRERVWLLPFRWQVSV